MGVIACSRKAATCAGRSRLASNAA
jgi:hypothetical protein